ncbi:hypothetical protein JTB14_031370 [Gonioctena quinquepunctata]|nr:hypothetical protein JTB14_031370 [Gonioctena quinquepunctata]
MKHNILNTERSDAHLRIIELIEQSCKQPSIMNGNIPRLFVIHFIIDECEELDYNSETEQEDVDTKEPTLSLTEIKALNGLLILVGANETERSSKYCMPIDRDTITT